MKIVTKAQIFFLVVISIEGAILDVGAIPVLLGILVITIATCVQDYINYKRR